MLVNDTKTMWYAKRSLISILWCTLEKFEIVNSIFEKLNEIFTEVVFFKMSNDYSVVVIVSCWDTKQSKFWFSLKVRETLYITCKN